ncbi:Uracil DNA glycosylase superfamily protein [Roseivivax sp. THAF40]|uniref:uracil-DNA glycosylase n=1 Tax=unclassified Roseivivax TaxID=2639302 RepID=UPI001267FE7C|nr:MULTISPECIES: uracil-DNA glycosylase [unclassified Roseivivax]QFS84282.1 Uracil DNA glycosylase superfamily protein [Roseivivax sp. THAF197b]QFT48110.1 Uracil DNA glycosylase superfamily protein [Roseivivax sp. THAF40]
MESIEQLDWHSAAAMLAWQAEMGVTETIAEFPVDRFAAAEAQLAEKAAQASVAVAAESARVAATEVDPVAVARDAASAAADLGALREAMAAFEHCDLKLGAERLVFGDGDPSARLMIVGEAPGRDEDREGRPFVGRAGQLLDRMLAAVGLDRQAKGAEGVYITNVLPWRPPQNRDPKPAEIEMLKPFLDRHIALADPDILVVMGNISAQAMLGRRGITRLRGTWMEALDRPVMPMFHPAYLLRNPAAKREAWADLLDLQAKLKETAS